MKPGRARAILNGMQASVGPLRCDACGAPAGEEHIRQRIERLELATRFRPIHINILFLEMAPPVNIRDYFYRAAPEPAEHTPGTRVLFEELLFAAGVTDAAKDKESCLIEFQRAGFYLADCVECPLEGSDGALDPAELARRCAGTVAKRILYSYKPRHIVLLSRDTRGLIPVLEQAGIGDRLLLHQGAPFELPKSRESEARKRFRASLAEAVAQAR